MLSSVLDDFLQIKTENTIINENILRLEEEKAEALQDLEEMKSKYKKAIDFITELYKRYQNS